MKLDSMFSNLINGNLSDARRQAKRVSWNRIFKSARLDMGWSESKAIAAADYLKASDGETRDAFQRYCDADNRKVQPEYLEFLNNGQ